MTEYGPSSVDESRHKHSAGLIAALAESNKSRLRLSIPPLFLEHPEIGSHDRKSANHLNPAGRLIHQYYYTAAVWLQRKHRPRFDLLIGRKDSLPVYFSSELGLQNTDNPTINLQRLAGRHRILSATSNSFFDTSTPPQAANANR